MNELALFAGAGGGILGGTLLGWRTVCAVEIESYAAGILCARQNDGLLTPFPVWSDVCTFDGKLWRGLVDVVSGGFPCQDISIAKGGGGAGITGPKSGLWSEFARIICDVEPPFVFVENSPVLTSRGLDRVLGDLAAMGFNADWCVCWGLAPSVPRIKGNGYGFWLGTPTAWLSHIYQFRPEAILASTYGCTMSSVVRWMLAHHGRVVTPRFTEWMMGWPPGWTAFAPLETGRFHQWLHSHGASSPGVLQTS